MPLPSRRSKLTSRLTAAEQAALARFRSGDRGVAFQELVRGQLAALAGLARRILRDEHSADDLVQETLVRAYGGLDAFRGESSLRTWLLRILVHLAKEPRRWSRTPATPPEPLELEIPDSLGPAPDGPAVERELRARLDEALERLTTRQRTAFHLRAVEGMDYRAIADTLDCQPAAARMLVLAARRKVMERMEGYLEP